MKKFNRLRFSGQKLDRKLIKAPTFRISSCKEKSMSKLKLITMAALFSFIMIGSASAEPWGRPYRGYYRPYGPPVYAYPPVAVAPPPIVNSPYPAAPVYVAPPPVVYGPPAYGIVRGPGFGVFIR